MDYIIGSFATLITVGLFWWVGRVRSNRKIAMQFYYTQSNVHERTKFSLPYLPPRVLETQATKYYESLSVKILFTENQAYWIRDNVFYVADMNEDGFIDYPTSRPVDTMHMDKVELDRMSFIVEKLTEGKQNDRGDSGNTQL